jgi:hypothetical protein
MTKNPSLGPAIRLRAKESALCSERRENVNLDVVLVKLEKSEVCESRHNQLTSLRQGSLLHSPEKS